jgi:hypothetical protein
MAESASQTPEFELDQEAKDLKVEQSKAESRKAIAEANAATRKAVAPAGATAPLAGDVTFDAKSGSLVSVVAARQLEAAAATIAKRVALTVGEGAAVLLIEDRQIAQDDAVFEEVNARLISLRSEFAAAAAALVPPPTGTTTAVIPLAVVAAGLSTAIGLAQLGADLIAMFRTDITVSGRDVSVDRLALFAEVAEELREHGVPTALAGFGLVGKTQTLAKFAELLKVRTELQAAVGAKQQSISSHQRRIDGLLTRLEAQNAALDKARAEDVEKAARIADVVAGIDAELAILEAEPSYRAARVAIDSARDTVTRFDAFAVVVASVAEGSKSSPLVAAALREAVRDGIEINGAKRPITHILHLTVTSAGGDIITKKNRFASPDSAFLGAVQATYFLGDLQGRIASSGAVTKFGSAQFDFDEYTLVPKDA